MRHKVVDLEGPVHYLDFGGSGRPLVMVHGLGGSALNWMAVGSELATTHHAVALDLAGFGGTPLFNRSATVGANADLVHTFVKEVLGEPAELMGNSMGGHIAIVQAADHPDWVSGLVLVDAATPGPRVPRPEAAMFGAVATISIPGLGETLLDRQARRLGPEGLVMRALDIVCADPSRLDPGLVEAHIQLTRERHRLGRQNGRAFSQALRSTSLRMADPRFWSRVARVSAPTLIVHGKLDRVIPVSAARELARRRPDWTLNVLDGVGHVPMMEDPPLFLEVVRAWSASRIATASAAAS
jgi:pimeloyl-ACP methyl ester carboxylesterase